VVYGPAAGPLVFLVGAALLALLGLGTEAGVVETQGVAAAASGWPRGGRTAAARLVTSGPFPAERRGGTASLSEGRVRPRGGCGGLFRSLVQPLTRHLGDTEAVGAQEDVQQLLVRVAVEGGVLGQGADGVDQRERKLQQRPVELREGGCDLGSGEHCVDAVKPRLGQVKVEVGQADCSGGGGLLRVRRRRI
jgi:hypothetical protein